MSPLSRAIVPERCNTILYCQQWVETVHFYEVQLGFTAVFRNDWFVEFQLLENCYLSIADASRATIDSAAGQGITLTLRIADVQAVHDYLLAQGVSPTPIRPRWGAQLFYCYDPEGHRLEFWEE